MKNRIKYLIIAFVLSFLLFPINIFAMDTLTVNFKTTFAQDIDIENMGSLLIMMTDATPKSHDIELTYEKDYQYSLSGLVNGDIVIDTMMVSRDFSGKYLIDYNTTRVSPTEIRVDIKVTLAPKKVSTTVKIDQSIYIDIIGDKYVDKMTETIDSYFTDDDYDEWVRTSKPYDPDDDIIIEDTTTQSTKPGETTTNKFGQTDQDLVEQSKKLEETRKQHEKEEEINKRKSIYAIVLIVVIVLLLIAIIIVAIKFAKANK